MQQSALKSRIYKLREWIRNGLKVCGQQLKHFWTERKTYKSAKIKAKVAYLNISQFKTSTG